MPAEPSSWSSDCFPSSWSTEAISQWECSALMPGRLMGAQQNHPQCQCLCGQHLPLVTHHWEVTLSTSSTIPGQLGTHILPICPAGAAEGMLDCSRHTAHLLLTAWLCQHVGSCAARQPSVLQGDLVLPPLVTAPLWAPSQLSLFANSLVQLWQTSYADEYHR